MAALDRQPPAVQPVAPDGRFELVPLLFVRVSRRDLALVIGAVRHLAGAVSSHESVLAAEALDAVTLVRNSRSGCVAELRRLESLLLPRDDDVAALHAVLDRGNGASGDHGERVVLGVSDYAAYQRVTDRILATWHRGDCLARFLYRGVG